MVRLACPRCSLTFEAMPGAPTRCPRCDLDGGLAPAGPVRSHPANTARPAAVPVGGLRSKLAVWAFVCALAPFTFYLVSFFFAAAPPFSDGAEVPAGFLVFQAFGSIVGLGGPIAAIALGIAARRDPRTNQGSRNLALAAVIIGAITLGLYVVAILFIVLLVMACAKACGSVSGAAAVASLPCTSLTVMTPSTRTQNGWRDAFAHHPDLPMLRADVFPIRGLRLCVGCFTVYPVFAAASLLVWIWPVPSVTAWTAGLALAAMQGVSMAGWTIRRWHKVAVKTCLGIGGALLLRVVLESPWPDEAKALALAAGGLAVYASAQPRLQRIARMAAT